MCLQIGFVYLGIGLKLATKISLGRFPKGGTGFSLEFLASHRLPATLAFALKGILLL